MEFKFVDISDLTEQDLIEVLNHNVRCAEFKRKEIDKMEKATASSEIEITDIPQEPAKVKEKKEIIDEDFEDEIDYYLSDFRNASLEELNEDYEEVLPSRKNGNHKKIILRIIAELNKDIKEINEMITSEIESMSSKELTDYKKEVDELTARIAILKKALKEEKEDTNTDNKKENTVIYAPTETGNIRILDDFKSIPSDYYEGFIELLDSIKDGSFKNIKRFKNNEALKPALEVKGFQIRVVFFRVAKNTYIVLTAFIKKTDNNAGYRKPLEIKVTNYKNVIAPKLKKLITDKEFLEENRKTDEEVYRVLNEAITRQERIKGDENDKTRNS